MMLYYWRGCVQGPGYTSKYSNLPESNEKITRKCHLQMSFLSTLSTYLLPVFSFAVSIFRYGPWTQHLVQQKTSFLFLHLFVAYICAASLPICFHFSDGFLYWICTLNPEHSLPARTASIHIFYIFFGYFLAIFLFIVIYLRNKGS